VRNLFVINAKDFADALENWIIDNKCNPSTPEEWERCMNDIHKSGQAQYVGSVEDKEVGKLKESLKKDFNVKEFKDLKEPNNENS